MTSWKALCILLLLQSTNFSENRCLEKDSNSVKKVAVPAEQAEAETIARDLERRITKISYRAARAQGDRQFAFIYLQPTGQSVLHLDNVAVRNKLNGARGSASALKNGNPDPPRPAAGVQDDTNFRMAYRGPAAEKGNTEHSEYKLLHGDGLQTMVTSFKQRQNNACPKYVLIYSRLLPCMAPINVDTLARLPGSRDRCLEMINIAKTGTQNLPGCASTRFYLYTYQNQARSGAKIDQAYFNAETQSLATNQITWLHP